MNRIAAVLIATVMLLGCSKSPQGSPNESALTADPLTNGLLFQPPEGWEASGKPSGVLFFDAPGLESGQSCRIAVIPPRRLAGSFREWFELVQEPDDTLKESGPIEGTGRGGTQTLRLTKVVEKGSEKRYQLHRIYHGIRDGDQYALLLFTADSEALFQRHLPAFDAMAANWDPSGQLPVLEAAEDGK